MAKLYASEVYVKVAQNGMQVMGDTVTTKSSIWRGIFGIAGRQRLPRGLHRFSAI